jgi:hypothetical protein
VEEHCWRGWQHGSEDDINRQWWRRAVSRVHFRVLELLGAPPLIEVEGGGGRSRNLVTGGGDAVGAVGAERGRLQGITRRV